ncbi:hypothetical protein GOP47_0016967 [Adiantum capillus-veneris]|uniref:RNA helicase n=1 Tax=Adiantum capillus-veneris TaxID=13818 RepID=A0A9D4UJD2_ADICA|nr:hypothetical protein GOP47_0016967 [Adiantum capillus-veneris]
MQRVLLCLSLQSGSRSFHPAASSFSGYPARSFGLVRARFVSLLAQDEFSDDEYGYEDRKGCRTYANIDAWKWKLSVLLRNPIEREIVTRDKRDKRDYPCLAALAQRMGIYSQVYGKVMVFSKIPLPNYRPDMDDKRPTRKVSIPLSVQQAVQKTLEEHLERKEVFGSKILMDNLISAWGGEKLPALEPPSLVEDFSVQSPLLDNVLLLKRNMHLRDRQQTWQESSEGKEMLAFREKLPAYKERDSFLLAVKRHQVLVVSGETGCGKTTQLPQYILESEIQAGQGGSCNIICTQPRRISAISVAERVAVERGEQLGESVGYKVRLEGMRGMSTRLLFCTTGILLRKLMADPDLKGVSHVIVDEIHERGMNEDFLLVVLKDLLVRRKDLRVVLMSATLNAKLFSSFFDGAPLLHISGFTYPVNIHFLEDVLELTGYRFGEFDQVDDYGQEKAWKMQKMMQRSKRNPLVALAEDAIANADLRKYSGETQLSLSQWNPECFGFNLIEAVLCYICKSEREGAILVFMTGWEDINALKDCLMRNPLLGNPSKVKLLPCHGSMASADQKLIFEPVPAKIRKIVLATNLAETSITINDIVFVLDCGKAKETSYDALNNTPCLTPTWISKASARQRRGRAGRVQPGECYHLYPKAVFEALTEYQEPELLRTPLHSLCLQIKSLKLGNIGDFLAKAMQTPDPLSVRNSVQLLKTIGALDDEEELTNLGIHLANLPVDPRIGKMLIFGAIFSCLDPVLSIAAGLTVRDPFVLPVEKKEVAEAAKHRFGRNDFSDHIALVRAYDRWKETMDAGTAVDYCWKNFLSFSTMQVIHSLRRQFEMLLRQAGFVDPVPEYTNQYSKDVNLLKGIICAGMFPGISSAWTMDSNTKYKTVEDGAVLLHQSSVISKIERMPYPWVAFYEKIKSGNILLRDGTAISDSMLLLFGGKLYKSERAGHLHMQEGLLQFTLHIPFAEVILWLRRELDNIVSQKLKNPKLDVLHDNKRVMSAVLELLHGDKSEGKFLLPDPVLKPRSQSLPMICCKSLLNNRLQKAGYKAPKYTIKAFRNKTFEASVAVRGRRFKGKAAATKRQAEQNVAAEALDWLDGLMIAKEEKKEAKKEQLQKKQNEKFARFLIASLQVLTGYKVVAALHYPSYGLKAGVCDVQSHTELLYTFSFRILEKSGVKCLRTLYCNI